MPSVSGLFALGCKSACGVDSLSFLFSLFFFLNSCFKMLCYWAVGCLPLDVKVCAWLILFRFSFRSFFSLLTLALKCYTIGQWVFILGRKSVCGVDSLLFLLSLFFSLNYSLMSIGILIMTNLFVFSHHTPQPI